MSDPTLSWVNVFTRDLDALPAFYMEVFGYAEIPEVRNSVFRGLFTGRSALGFMAPDVYGILHLGGHEHDEGIKMLLNFDVANVDEVDRLTPVAVARGATLVKAAGMTSYGWYQATLLDPEGNVFRINTVVNGFSLEKGRREQS
jgi:predicted enzyme related to lactoylglutathione lyase